MIAESRGGTMSARSARRTAGAGAILALLIAAGWQLASTEGAAAVDRQTTAVTAGPSTFTQATPSGGPSQYNTPYERCAYGTDHSITGTNPILGEPLTTKFTSNVPLSLSVKGTGTDWWASRDLIFTNRSTKTFNIDCAVIIVRAPASAGNHPYANAQPYGHPQKDYLEVPRGDGTSFYVIRIGFHDVPLSQRLAYPGQTFDVRLDGPAGPITLEQTRDSVRFYADLDLAANTSMILKYGTHRLPD
jgi:hypothetical protein